MSVSRRGAVIVALALLAGCGHAPDSRPYDDADVLFATEMIPHHQQAVAMAELAPAHGESRPVQAVASQISAEQIPEIAQLRGVPPDDDHAPQGALTMVKAELVDGRDPDATLMAQNISDAQQASIELMQRLLAGK